MNALLKGIALILFATFLSASAGAAEHGTAEEASTLAKEAIAYLKANRAGSGIYKQ